MIFFTSDLHLGHEMIVRYRPFDTVAQMNSELIRRWNALVDPGDEVYVLGDVVMGRMDDNLPLVKRLNGTKYLVPGNHDRVHPCYGTPLHRVNEWRRRYEEVGFTLLDVEHDHGDWRLCHFPTSGDHTADERFPEWRPQVAEGRWVVHGHVHDAWTVRGRQLNVGVDVWDFSPVPEAVVHQVMRECDRA